MNSSSMKMAWHYIKDIVVKTYNISIYYSPSFAFYGLLWWIGFFCRSKYSWQITSFALSKKTNWLDAYIEKKYSDIINKFQHLTESKNEESIPHNTIWIFWGQGEDSMPKLVRACYNQLRKYNDNIILLTKENIDEYISLNSRILEKVNLGLIGYANYSDIIRNTLLKTHGGLWLDSTVWVSETIPFKTLYNMPVYTANCKEKISRNSVRFWSSYQWNWSSWCLWANNSNRIFFSFVSEMLSEIALREKYWPDYVIQDYLFYYACRNFPIVRKQFAEMNIHNPNKDTLAFFMDKEFNLGEYQNLTKNECFFKLRYRKAWPISTPDGRETYYSRILKDTI